MIKHGDGLLLPLFPGLMKLSDKLAPFGVSTHNQRHWQLVTYFETEVAKLSISLTGRERIFQSWLNAFEVSAI